MDATSADLARVHVPRPSIDPRMMRRALTEGRVRGIALDTLVRCLDRPQAAGGILRRAMREARALHSRERRFVSDALYAQFRWRGLLVHRLGDAATTGDQRDRALARWLGWMAWLGAPDDALHAAWTEARSLPEVPTPPLARARRLHDLSGVTGTAARLSRAADLPVALATELLGVLCPPDVRSGDPSEGSGPDDPERPCPEAAAWLDASNRRAPTTLRARTPTRGGRGRRRILSELARREVEATPTTFAPHGLVVPPRTDVRALPAYRRGDVELQDEASQLVALLATPPRGGRVLDWCAGAGGKSLALADLLGPHGRIVATDIRGRALGELQRRARRAGLEGIRTAVIDPDTHTPSTPLGTFEVVLVDAPCTGTGVWRRHPDGRVRTRALDETLALQAAVLDAAAEHVAPGGTLIYATCSVLPSEDEAQVRAFLQRHPAFVPLPVDELLPEDVDRTVVTGPFLRTWPHRHGTDGFFAAALARLEG